MEKRSQPNESIWLKFAPSLLILALTQLFSEKSAPLNALRDSQLRLIDVVLPMASNEKARYRPAISVEVIRGTQIDAFSIRNLGEVSIEDFSTFELVFDHFQIPIEATFDSKPVTGKIRALRTGESMPLIIPNETINTWLKSKSSAVHGGIEIKLHAVGGKVESTSYSFELQLYKCNQGHVHLKVSSLQRDPLMKLGDF